MAAKTVNYSDTTGLLTGTATINAKIPGAFQTIDPTSPNFTGRQLLKMGAWFEGRAAGDKISSMIVKDIDGVIPVPYRAAFSAYPIIAYLHDTTVDAANQGIALPPSGPFQIEFPTNNPRTKIASGLYIVFTFQKGIFGALIAADTAVVNLAWDDLT